MGLHLLAPDGLTGALLPLAQAAGGAAAGGQQGSPMPVFFMFGALALLFYVIILRPQKQEQKKRDELVNSLAKGDHVVTNGGIHGTVEAIEVGKGIVSLTIAPKTTIRVERWAVSTVTPKGKGGQNGGEEKAAGEK